MNLEVIKEIGRRKVGSFRDPVLVVGTNINEDKEAVKSGSITIIQIDKNGCVNCVTLGVPMNDNDAMYLRHYDGKGNSNYNTYFKIVSIGDIEKHEKDLFPGLIGDTAKENIRKLELKDRYVTLKIEGKWLLEIPEVRNKVYENTFNPIEIDYICQLCGKPAKTAYRMTKHFKGKFIIADQPCDSVFYNKDSFYVPFCQECYTYLAVGFNELFNKGSELCVCKLKPNKKSFILPENVLDEKEYRYFSELLNVVKKENSTITGVVHSIQSDIAKSYLVRIYTTISENNMERIIHQTVNVPPKNFFGLMIKWNEIVSRLGEYVEDKYTKVSGDKNIINLMLDRAYSIDTKKHIMSMSNTTQYISIIDSMLSGKEISKKEWMKIACNDEKNLIADILSGAIVLNEAVFHVLENEILKEVICVKEGEEFINVDMPEYTGNGGKIVNEIHKYITQYEISPFNAALIYLGACIKSIEIAQQVSGLQSHWLKRIQMIDNEKSFNILCDLIINSLNAYQDTGYRIGRETLSSVLYGWFEYYFNMQKGTFKVDECLHYLMLGYSFLTIFLSSVENKKEVNGNDQE